MTSGGQTPDAPLHETTTGERDDRQATRRPPRGRRIRYQAARIGRLRDDFEVTQKALWREYHGLQNRLEERLAGLADHPEAAAVTELRREVADLREVTAERLAAIERRLDEVASQTQQRMDDFLVVFARSAGWLANEAERLRS